MNGGMQRDVWRLVWLMKLSNLFLFKKIEGIKHNNNFYIYISPYYSFLFVKYTTFTMLSQYHCNSYEDLEQIPTDEPIHLVINQFETDNNELDLSNFMLGKLEFSNQYNIKKLILGDQSLMTDLHIDKCRILNKIIISNLVELTKCSITKCKKINNLECLSSCVKLKSINVRLCSINNLNDLENTISTIEVINCSYNKINTISVMKEAVELKVLYADYNSITNLVYLCNSKKLELISIFQRKDRKLSIPIFFATFANYYNLKLLRFNKYNNIIIPPAVHRMIMNSEDYYIGDDEKKFFKLKRSELTPEQENMSNLPNEIKQIIYHLFNLKPTLRLNRGVFSFLDNYHRSEKEIKDGIKYKETSSRACYYYDCTKKFIYAHVPNLNDNEIDDDLSSIISELSFDDDEKDEEKDYDNEEKGEDYENEDKKENNNYKYQVEHPDCNCSLAQLMQETITFNGNLNSELNNNYKEKLLDIVFSKMFSETKLTGQIILAITCLENNDYFEEQFDFPNIQRKANILMVAIEEYMDKDSAIDFVNHQFNSLNLSNVDEWVQILDEYF